MTLLPLKAKISQYTGLFLASKEQSDYIDSDEFWEQFKEYAEHPSRDKSYRDIYSIIIGSWQAENGFYKQAKFDLKRIFSKGVNND